MREKILKKWMVLLLAASMIFSFAACGGKEELAETPEGTVEEETVTEEKAEAGSASETETPAEEESGREPEVLYNLKSVSEEECLGIWINTVPGHYREYTMVLEKGGKGTAYFLGKEASLTWGIDRSSVNVYTELPNNLLFLQKSGMEKWF